MQYILIWVVLATNGNQSRHYEVATGSQPFNSHEACRTAAHAMKNAAGNLYRVRTTCSNNPH